ncbi:unnamed protein product [Bursaphelenchus xylophilus]|uniref:Aspartyl aminopeptidase n=1 Tax=Bursaphelenchus xylophilus TaxID=6326 RepID=A0A1I7S983_BURXY|nr:unnamed protein product [Bursaphelenchus xylophilus]CAG9100429.1 unnamed protein product [Bursaphelenchus xylophilus]
MFPIFGLASRGMPLFFRGQWSLHLPLQYSSFLSTMAQNEFTRFLDQSPTPYHAVNSCAKYLRKNGFQELSLANEWNLQKGGRYYTVKAHSTIIAFVLGGKYEPQNGFVVVGAHTDSPCLRVRPVSKLSKEKFKQVAVSTYGGGIWRTWFDRGLGLAGLVTVKRADGKIEHCHVDLGRKPLLFIPNLAIHLETDRLTPKVDTEEHLQPIFCLDDGEEGAEKYDHHVELLNLIAQECGCKVEDVIDFDLRTFPTENAELGGLKNEFVFSARLDNLLGVYTTIHGLVEGSKKDVELAEDTVARVAVCFDHEEVGSGSAAGAKSAVFEQVLRRLVLKDEPTPNDSFARAMAKSFIISADQAHAAHPNYADRHERNHRPRFDGSVVVKINADQRYATTTTSFTVLNELARLAEVKLTKFVVKNTSPCGSTIGPFISANLGCLTIDVGCAQLGMHSARECGDTQSVENAIRLYSTTYNNYGKLIGKIDL